MAKKKRSVAETKNASEAAVEALTSALGNFSCDVGACECEGFIPKILDFTECKREFCQHGISHHI